MGCGSAPRLGLQGVQPWYPAVPRVLAKLLGLALSWELVPQKESGPCLGCAEGSRGCVCHTQPLPASQQWLRLWMGVRGGTNSGGPGGLPGGDVSWLLGSHRGVMEGGGGSVRFQAEGKACVFRDLAVPGLAWHVKHRGESSRTELDRMALESHRGLLIEELHLVGHASHLCPSVCSRSGQSPAGWPLLAGTMAEAGDAALSVAEWLRALHLEQYTGLFEQHGLLWATECQGLSDARLVDMGMLLPGHRRRILAGLLRAHTPPAPAPRSTPRPVPMKRHVFRLPPAPTTPPEPLPTAGEDEGLLPAPPIPPRRSCLPPACFSAPSTAAPDPVVPPLPAKRHLAELSIPPVPPRTGSSRLLVR